MSAGSSIVVSFAASLTRIMSSILRSSGFTVKTRSLTVGTRSLIEGTRSRPLSSAKAGMATRTIAITKDARTAPLYGPLTATPSRGRKSGTMTVILPTSSGGAGNFAHTVTLSFGSTRLSVSVQMHLPSASRITR